MYLIDAKNSKKGEADDDEVNDSTNVEASKSATTSSDSEKISKPEKDELEQRFTVSEICFQSQPSFELANVAF